MNHQISIYLFIPIFDTFVAMKLWLRSGRVTCVECNFSPSAVHTPMHFVEFHSSLLIFYDRMWRYLWNLYLQTSMNDKPICCFRIQLMASHARTQWCANSWSSPGPGVRHFFFLLIATSPLDEIEFLVANWIMEFISHQRSCKCIMKNS